MLKGVNMISKMRAISNLKNISLNMYLHQSVPIAMKLGSAGAAISGIHTLYNFSPTKDDSIPYNSAYLFGEVVIKSFGYGYMGMITGFLWPIAVPCWIISTIKCVNVKEN
jgi:hypothetical protein